MSSEKNAFSYTLPSHYLAKKIASKNTRIKSAIIHFQLLKPSYGKKTNLWNGKIYFQAKTDITGRKEEFWPLIPMIIEPSSKKLLLYWKLFGLPVSSEKELIKEPKEAPKEAKKIEKNLPPYPFYKKDPSVVLYRDKKEIFYSITTKRGHKKILIQKNSLKPVAIESPCPQDLYNLIWNIVKTETCKLEFKYTKGNKNKINEAHLNNRKKRNSYF